MDGQLPPTLYAHAQTTILISKNRTMITFFRDSATKIKINTTNLLETYSSPSSIFFILISGAALIISAGLLLENTSVIIGGMVVAPLITPIFGFSLGIITFKPLIIFKSLSSILAGSILSIAISFLVGIIYRMPHFTHSLLNQEIVSKAEPNVLFFLVAIVSGIVGTISYAREQISEKITGIAISAAIVPPLSVIGLAWSETNIQLMISSSLLFILNLLGIIFGSICTFIILGFGKK